MKNLWQTIYLNTAHNQAKNKVCKQPWQIPFQAKIGTPQSSMGIETFACLGCCPFIYEILLVLFCSIVAIFHYLFTATLYAFFDS